MRGFSCIIFCQNFAANNYLKKSLNYFIGEYNLIIYLFKYLYLKIWLELSLNQRSLSQDNRKYTN